MRKVLSDPHRSHGEAGLKHLGRYLIKGYIFNPVQCKSLDCYINADFYGNWDRNIANKNVDTVQSQMGSLSCICVLGIQVANLNCTIYCGK